jgi:hypothetical protein
LTLIPCNRLLRIDDNFDNTSPQALIPCIEFLDSFGIIKKGEIVGIFS